jgi:hypothetical protein
MVVMLLYKAEAMIINPLTTMNVNQVKTRTEHFADFLKLQELCSHF